MKRSRTLALIQSGIRVLSAILVFNYGARLEGTEFSGGRVTGPLLEMSEFGALLLIVAAALTFFYVRIAAGN
jgi:hypothetical protein